MANVDEIFGDFNHNFEMEAKSTEWLLLHLQNKKKKTNRLFFDASAKDTESWLCE